jgi:hypothetical protein
MVRLSCSAQYGSPRTSDCIFDLQRNRRLVFANTSQSWRFNRFPNDHETVRQQDYEGLEYCNVILSGVPIDIVNKVYIYLWVSRLQPSLHHSVLKMLLQRLCKARFWSSSNRPHHPITCAASLAGDRFQDRFQDQIQSRC